MIDFFIIPNLLKANENILATDEKRQENDNSSISKIRIRSQKASSPACGKNFLAALSTAGLGWIWHSTTLSVSKLGRRNLKIKVSKLSKFDRTIISNLSTSREIGAIAKAKQNTQAKTHVQKDFTRPTNQQRVNIDYKIEQKFAALKNEAHIFSWYLINGVFNHDRKGFAVFDDLAHIQLVWYLCEEYNWFVVLWSGGYIRHWLWLQGCGRRVSARTSVGGWYRTGCTTCRAPTHARSASVTMESLRSAKRCCAPHLRWVWLTE